MEINLDSSGRTPRLALAGEMGIYAAAELKARLLSAVEDCAELEIDLSRVEEIDSAGLQLLILAKRHALAQNKTLTLTGHSRAVLELLELYDVAAYFGDPMVITAHDAPGGKT